MVTYMYNAHRQESFTGAFNMSSFKLRINPPVWSINISILTVTNRRVSSLIKQNLLYYEVFNYFGIHSHFLFGAVAKLLFTLHPVQAFNLLRFVIQASLVRASQLFCHSVSTPRLQVMKPMFPMAHNHCLRSA